MNSKITNSIIYASLAGAIIGDLIPTPADAIFFSLEKSLKDKLNLGEISSKQYWERTAILYYTLNPIYWATLLGIAMMVKGDIKDKITVVSAIAGIGAVIGVIHSNIKKDVKA